MADGNDDGYSLRKRLAMGKPLPEGTFGVEPLGGVQGDAHTPVAREVHLKDHERGAGPPINGNQANPNHGDHRK